MIQYNDRINAAVEKKMREEISGISVECVKNESKIIRIFLKWALDEVKNKNSLLKQALYQ